MQEIIIVIHQVFLSFLLKNFHLIGTGNDRCRRFCHFVFINGVAPVVAPIVGGSMTDSVGWQGIFWVLFTLGFFLLLGSLNLRESLPVSRRQHASWKGVYLGFTEVIHNQRFVCYVLLYAFSQVVLFANISSTHLSCNSIMAFRP